MALSIVLPPKGDLVMPFLSVPVLAGYLRAQGVRELQVRDLNIEFHEWITQPAQLRRGLEELPAARRIADGGGDGTFDAELQRRRLQLLARIGPQVVEACEHAKAICRGQHGKVSLAERRRSVGLILHALDLAMVPYFPGSLDAMNIQLGAYSQARSSDIIKAITDVRVNPVIRFLEETFLPQVKAAPPRLLGVSLAYEHQLAPALTIARMVREASPDSRVIFGGSLMTRMGRKLARIEPLATLLDAIVTQDGEEALSELICQSEGAWQLENVPNLIYRTRSGEVRETTRRCLTGGGEIPTPDFSDMPLDLYFSPVTLLPLEHSRGCYWNRCTFCAHSFNYENRYRPRRTEAVAQDMATLIARHGARAFSLVDDCVSAAGCRRLADRIRESGIDVTWGVSSRLEPGMTEDICRKAYESGCRKLSFGLESGSQRVLDMMDKGTVVEDIPRVLEACRSAGIQALLTFFVGFPGSREEDEQQTVALLQRFPDVHISFTSFDLDEDSPVGCDPARFGVYDLRRDDRDDLTFEIESYRVRDGISQERASELVRELREGPLRSFHRLDGLLLSYVPIVADAGFHAAGAATGADSSVPATERVWSSALRASEQVAFGDPAFESSKRLREEMWDEQGAISPVLNEETYEAADLTRAAALLMHLCDGRNGDAVLTTFCETLDLSIEESREAVLDMLKHLLLRGLISIAPSPTRPIEGP